MEPFRRRTFSPEIAAPSRRALVAAARSTRIVRCEGTADAVTEAGGHEENPATAIEKGYRP
jgi:hypothetical protein